MPDNQQQQFDGENSVSGYTLFHGKDGKSYYLKGESLSDEDVTQRIKKLRGTQSSNDGGGPIPDANAQAKAYGARPLTATLPETVTPEEGESFEQTMNRGVRAGRQILSDPNKLRMANVRAEGQGVADAPLVLGAASLPSIAAHPIAAATGLAGSALGGSLFRGAANLFDASPAVAENMEGVGSALGGLSGSIFGPKALTTTKGAIGDLMRTPYGPTAGASALKPGVKAVASIGKYFGGPELADWMVPERSVGPTGPYSKLPSRLPSALRGDPFSPTPPEVVPELGSPENPGWFSKIPNKMPKVQAPPPDWQAPAHETLELGSPEYPGPFSKVPNRLPAGVRGDPFAPASQAATETPRIVPPSVGEPRFTGSEGRAATWKNEDVMQLAAQGNREAIQQAIRRGMQLPPGARYVMGDPDFSRTVYNPRESTSFTPEGTPIRNLQNPSASPRQRIILTDPYSPDVQQGNPSPFAPTAELMEPTGPRLNASGEAGGGGLEEAARLSSEKSQGVQYFRENSGGNRVPLTGMGRQDLRASPGQRIVRVDANGLETVLDEQPIRPGRVPRERRGPQ